MSEYRIITLSDSNYFDCGKLFLKTRHVINNHDIVLYGPDLSKNQIKTLSDNNIEYKQVSKKDFETKMQFMKFEMILDQLQIDKEKKYKGFLLIDWDIFFIRDWKHLYENEFDICLISRTEEIRKKIIRALVCGGAFFFKHSAKELFEYAQRVILNGGSKDLPEYDRIWKTLESGRPAHKTHDRRNLRWWVDQIFLSSIALRFLKEKNFIQKFGFSPVSFTFNGYNISMVSDKIYNRLNSLPVIKKNEDKNLFIRHLKHSGRIKLVGAKKATIKEKL